MRRGVLLVLVFALAVMGGIVATVVVRTRSHVGLATAAMPALSGHVPSVVAGPGHATHLKGPQALACSDCHDIRAGGFEKPSAARCQGCHERMHADLHQSSSAPPDAKECTACHAFVPPPAGSASDAWSCMRCHAEDQHGKPAIVVHKHEACGDCHRPHEEPATVPKDCTSCHDGQRAKKHAQPPARPCADCHQPHQSAPSGTDECLSCHSKKAPIVAAAALFAGGHERCGGCHTAHETTKPAIKRACRDCHATTHVVGEERVPQHAICTSCHDPHNVMGGPSGACVRCHTDAHKAQPVDVSRGCVACHQVHGKTQPATLTAAASGTNCVSCHKIAASNDALHSSRVVCASCHSQHGEQGGPKRTQACTQCHAKVVQLVSHNEGHAECRQCHASPHEPLPVGRDCASCHQTEAQSAPQGHMRCESCHEPHSGSRPECASCHKKESSGAHTQVQGGCATCHRPHGPKGTASPPACATCHKSLPALHQVPQHGTCKACHSSPHDPPRADRATCLTCHANKRDHERNAVVCTGCHNFGGER